MTFHDSKKNFQIGFNLICNIFMKYLQNFAYQLLLKNQGNEPLAKNRIFDFRFAANTFVTTDNE